MADKRQRPGQPPDGGKKDDKDKNLLYAVYDENGKLVEYHLEGKPFHEETVAELTAHIDKEYGAEVIARQGQNGHVLEVCDIQVANSATLLTELNAEARQEKIPEETLARLQGDYIMYARVDGQFVQKHISEEEYMKYLALDNDHLRLLMFNKVFGVERGNSVKVADSTNLTDAVQRLLGIERGSDIKDERCRQAAEKYLKNTELGRRFLDAGAQSIKPLGFDEGLNGVHYLWGEANGQQFRVMLSPADYQRLHALNSGLPQQAEGKSQGQTLSESSLLQQAGRTGLGLSALAGFNFAALSQELQNQGESQSMGLGR